jgi:hypothetical protein
MTSDFTKKIMIIKTYEQSKLAAGMQAQFSRNIDPNRKMSGDVEEHECQVFPRCACPSEELGSYSHFTTPSSAPPYPELTTNNSPQFKNTSPSPPAPPASNSRPSSRQTHHTRLFNSHTGYPPAAQHTPSSPTATKPAFHS